MKPRLRKHVFFRPTADGVCFWGHTQTLTLEGTGLYAWFLQVAPLLDGSRTLEEIGQRLGPGQQPLLAAMADALITHGMLADEAEARPHGLSPEEIEAYQEAIQLVGEFVGAPEARFERFRRSSILAVGIGRTLDSLLQFLDQMGAGRVQAIRSGSDVPPEGELERVVRKADAVAYAGPRSDRLADLLGELCREARKPYICGGLAAVGALVGPLSEPGSAGCMTCAQSRLRRWGHLADATPDAHTGPEPLVLAAMAGIRAGYELFTHLTGMTEPQTRGRMLVIDQDRLQDSLHPVVPESGCNCQPSTDRSGSPAEIGDRLEPFISPFTGLLGSLDAGDLPQLPLTLVRATYPGGAVVAAGRNSQEARNRAAAAALRILGAERSGGMPGQVYSLGRFPAECYGTGLLQLLHGRALSGEISLRPLVLSGSECRDCLRHYHALTVRYGLKIALWIASFEAGGHVVLVGVGDRLLANAAERTPAAAAHDALMTALGLVQQQDASDASWVADLPPLPTGREGDLLQVDGSCEAPDWAEWWESATERLRELGHEPILSESARDPLVTGAGLVAAWIGIGAVAAPATVPQRKRSALALR